MGDACQKNKSKFINHRGNVFPLRMYPNIAHWNQYFVVGKKSLDFKSHVNLHTVPPSPALRAQKPRCYNEQVDTS